MLAQHRSRSPGCRTRSVAARAADSQARPDPCKSPSRQGVNPGAGRARGRQPREDASVEVVRERAPAASDHWMAQEVSILHHDTPCEGRIRGRRWQHPAAN
jgi:hypothetical protein